MDQEFEDIISCRREDDHVIAEMLGITSDLDCRPPQGEAGDDIDDYGPDFISAIKDAHEYEHYDNTWLIGVIRGAKRTPLRFEGRWSPWLNVKELLAWVEKKRPKMHLGVRGLLHMAQTYNKQRFQFRGRFRDPRCDCIGQAYYPSWVSAGHGHHRTLAGG